MAEVSARPKVPLMLSRFRLFCALAGVLLGCGTKSIPCKVDSDCKVISDYCRCECRSAHATEPNPSVCLAGGCNTVVDICAGSSAVCSAGTCALVAPGRDAGS